MTTVSVNRVSQILCYIIFVGAFFRLSFASETFDQTSIKEKAFSPDRIPSVSTIDTSSGYIAGEVAQFWMTIPKQWNGFVVVDREKLDFAATGVEKLVFSYVSENKIYRPAKLMEFYVFDKKLWQTIEFKKIAETQKYFFAVLTYPNTFTGVTDSNLFDYYLEQVSNDDFVISMIGFPDDQRFLVSETVTVNGKRLKSKIYKDDKVYVPVREVCEALGYSVGWLGKEKAVTISGKNRYFLMLTKETELYQNYKVLTVDGKAYVSLLFFINSLNTNVEVDEDFNVTIKE